MTLQQDPHNSYPRPLWIRILRELARFWYLLFVVLAGNILFNLIQLAASDNLAALFDWHKVSRVLLVDKLLLVLEQRPVVIVPAAVVLGALVILGRIAHNDREKERQFLEQDKRQREIEEVSRAAAQVVLSQEQRRPAASHLPVLPPEPPSAEPKGPPHDNLPTAEGHFVGRVTELRQLLQWLRTPGLQPVVFITGIGGIGKTALAAEAIKDLIYEDVYPDGIGVVLAQDKTNATTVLREALARFDPQRRQPPATTPDELQRAAQRLLHGKRVLVVIDNVEPGLDLAAVLQPLVQAGAIVLLTTREGESVGAPGETSSHVVAQLPSELQRMSRTLPLGLLSQDEAVELFTKESGPGDIHDWTPAQRAAVDRIVASLRQHTLAVKLAARYAKDANVDVVQLAEELDDPQRVTELGGDIATIYYKSRNALTPTAQRLFRQCGAFATPEFSVRAVTAVAAAFGDREPKATLDLLLRRGLVSARRSEGFPEPADTDRLELHPVLYGFARREFEQALQLEQDRTRLAIANYYARYSTSTYRDALALDERNIEGALEWAHQAHQAEPVARMCVGMQAYWRDYGRRAARQRYLPWGLEAAQQLVRARHVPDAQELLALLKLGYAQFLRLQGKVREAKRISRGILRTFRRLGNLPGEGSTLVLLANIARDQGSPDLAEQYLSKAYVIFTDPRVSDPANTALVLAFRGQIRERTGTRNAEADSDLAASYDLYNAINNAWGRGLALQLRARISLRRGLFEEAYGRYSDALAIHQRLQSRRAEAVDISSLGQIACGRGQYSQAETLYRQSLDIRRETGDTRGEAVDLTLLGQLDRTREHYELADKRLGLALAIWRSVGDVRGVGWATSETGQLALAQGHAGIASRLLRDALKHHRKAADAPAQAVTLCAFGNLAFHQRRIRRAQVYFDKALHLATIVEDPFTQGQSLRGLAMCAERAHDMTRAGALFEQSLTLAQQGESPLSHADALAALGAFLVRTQPTLPRGAALLAEATHIYDTLGLHRRSGSGAIA
jgi:tetratricopeptide (TPR) repeat protein